MNWNKLRRYKDKEEFIADVKKRAFEMEMNHHGCSQVVVQTYLDILEEKNLDLFLAASPFAAGMSLTGNNCGALIGALMILGTVYGRADVKENLEGLLRGIRPMRKLVRYFMQRNANIDCRAITGTDLADPQKALAYFDSGGLEKCAGIISDTSGFIADILYDEGTKQRPK
jgi:C_GCAxxG_C_C family probable redox protein